MLLSNRTLTTVFHYTLVLVRALSIASNYFKTLKQDSSLVQKRMRTSPLWLLPFTGFLLDFILFKKNLTTYLQSLKWPCPKMQIRLIDLVSALLTTEIHRLCPSNYPKISL